MLPEFFNGKMKLLYFRTPVTDKLHKNIMQHGRIFHVFPGDLFSFLYQNNGLGIFKNDVVFRVSERKFFSDFLVKIIFGIFAFPVPPIQLQHVFHCAVRAFP